MRPSSHHTRQARVLTSIAVVWRLTSSPRCICLFSLSSCFCQLHPNRSRSVRLFRIPSWLDADEGRRILWLRRWRLVPRARAATFASTLCAGQPSDGSRRVSSKLAVAWVRYVSSPYGPHYSCAAAGWETSLSLTSRPSTARSFAHHCRIHICKHSSMPCPPSSA